MSDVVEAIINAEDLPTPPAIALRLLELYRQPDVEVNEMATLIGSDPVLTAKLIGYCNSPLLGRARETTTINKAIVFVGMQTVKILALSFSLVRTRSESSSSFDYDQFWSQSLATAVTAKVIGERIGGTGDSEFLTGLMLKIGRVGLAHTFPEQYSALIQRSLDSGADLVDLEEQQWSINEFTVGSELLKHWNFPTEMIQSIANFGQNQDQVADDENQTVRTLSLAERLVSMLFAEDLLAEEVNKTKELAQEWFGIECESFGEFFDQAMGAWTDFAKLLSFDASQAETFEQLEGRARKGIAHLSMGLHAENVAINQENQELRVNALADGLTGLKNRRAYDQEAHAEWDRSSRMRHPFVLMMVDIDHFKKVNDDYGHSAGDLVLVAVANVLKNNTRQYDLVFRMGGEEFVVLLPECTGEDAIGAAERYRSAIESLEVRVGEQTIRVTASFGVATQEDGQSNSLESLYEHADKLLYQAKDAGRNRVCICPTISNSSRTPYIARPVQTQTSNSGLGQT